MHMVGRCVLRWHALYFTPALLNIALWQLVLCLQFGGWWWHSMSRWQQTDMGAPLLLPRYACTHTTATTPSPNQDSSRNKTINKLEAAWRLVVVSPFVSHHQFCLPFGRSCTHLQNSVLSSSALFWATVELLFLVYTYSTPVPLCRAMWVFYLWHANSSHTRPLSRLPSLTSSFSVLMFLAWVQCVCDMCISHLGIFIYPHLPCLCLLSCACIFVTVFCIIIRLCLALVDDPHAFLHPVVTFGLRNVLWCALRHRFSMVRVLRCPFCTHGQTFTDSYYSG